MSDIPVHLSDGAAAHVRDWLARQDTPPRGLRLGVKPTGCSGYQYVVSAAVQVNEQDTCFTSQGIDIVVDSHSLQYLKGTELDFVHEGLRSGFRFHNPNVAETCGCGESFTPKQEQVEQS